MNLNCFTRPNKPLVCAMPDFNIKTPLVLIEPPKLLTVDRGTECHTTPDHIADLMVQYLDVKEYDSVCEPHCGTGQLINALIKNGVKYTNIVGIEKNNKLVEFTLNRFKEYRFLKINQGCVFDRYFDDFKPNDNDEYSGVNHIICNPPFKQIIKHIDRIHSFLKIGGVAICLVPITYKKINHEVLEILPSDTFSYCKVNTKIIKIIK